MNYELAKELKEAGFPQATANTVYLSPPENLKCKNGEWVYIPTLEELIEACGERFWNVSIRHEGGKYPWIAAATDPIVETGSAPSEAVARLWLALNKK